MNASIARIGKLRLYPYVVYGKLRLYPRISSAILIETKFSPSLKLNFTRSPSFIQVRNYRVGPPFLLPPPKWSELLSAVLGFSSIWLDRSTELSLLITWLCAGPLGGKSEVRCPTILTVTRSQKKPKSQTSAVPVLYEVSVWVGRNRSKSGTFYFNTYLA